MHTDVVKMHLHFIVIEAQSVTTCHQRPCSNIAEHMQMGCRDMTSNDSNLSTNAGATMLLPRITWNRIPNRRERDAISRVVRGRERERWRKMCLFKFMCISQMLNNSTHNNRGIIWPPVLHRPLKVHEYKYVFYFSCLFILCSSTNLCVAFFILFYFIFFGFDLHHTDALAHTYVLVSWRVYWDRNNKQKWRYFNRMWIKISFTIVLVLCGGWLTYLAISFSNSDNAECKHARVERDRSK